MASGDSAGVSLGSGGDTVEMPGVLNAALGIPQPAVWSWERATAPPSGDYVRATAFRVGDIPSPAVFAPENDRWALQMVSVATPALHRDYVMMRLEEDWSVGCAGFEMHPRAMELGALVLDIVEELRSVTPALHRPLIVEVEVGSPAMRLSFVSDLQWSNFDVLCLETEPEEPESGPGIDSLPLPKGRYIIGGKEPDLRVELNMPYEEMRDSPWGRHSCVSLWTGPGSALSNTQCRNVGELTTISWAWENRMAVPHAMRLLFLYNRRGRMVCYSSIRLDLDSEFDVLEALPTIVRASRRIGGREEWAVVEGKFYAFKFQPRFRGHPIHVQLMKLD